MKSLSIIVLPKKRGGCSVVFFDRRGRATGTGWLAKGTLKEILSALDPKPEVKSPELFEALRADLLK